ncbi:MAG TPA: squalene--hopene cyclase [Burkholderiales bacterium]|nr:squalene--hopene cyclase [Burkholderiales bacterium]
MRTSFVPDSLTSPPSLDPGRTGRQEARVDPTAPAETALRGAVAVARDALLSLQHPEGHWVFELEADCTIPAEYILMMHFMDEIDVALQAKIAAFLRAHQDAHGGWSLYRGGRFDLSCSVKAYYALKLAGDAPHAAHMRAAREAILRHGGAARSNVFTRLTLAVFGQVPWRAVPMVPVEIMLLPRWFPFHLSKVSYWSRTVMVPLAILYSLRARAKNPRQLGIAELFTTPPEQETGYFPARSLLNRVLLRLERLGRLLEPAVPSRVRRHALKRATAWFLERLNGTDGLGGIFPAMVNAHECLALLGYAPDHPHRVSTKTALERLLVTREDSAYCQPCFSVVWDTGIACQALYEAEGRRATPEVLRGLDWLLERQLLDAPGDWREYRPRLASGGWPFQFGNIHYPDIDDTAMVAWAMHLVDAPRYRGRVERAAQWVSGMQSKNGGFGAFDADNTHYHLNEIPFADHGALLDPPTSDVTGRCLALLGPLGPAYQGAVRRSLAFLRAEQESDGSWFGRWGTNYIYGTWSVLSGLERASVTAEEPYVQRAVTWLKRVQRRDGGWGESNDTYLYPERAGQHHTSTAFQTAWAMLGLMAAGEVDSPEVARGAQYLLRAQQPDGLWSDPDFTAPGFPRVFYLKYHGYDKYFPLWALARYRNLRTRRRG